MTTIHRTEEKVKASGNSSKKKPKVSEIYMDIKNGVAAREILEKHQISLQQLKMIMMHCYKKGMLKKEDLVRNFVKSPLQGRSRIIKPVWPAKRASIP